MKIKREIVNFSNKFFIGSIKSENQFVMNMLLDLLEDKISY